jgi:hypothetical protein
MNDTYDEKIRNCARRSPLAGRPCLQRYENERDMNDLVDKETFERMYKEKWQGAPWLKNGDGTIVLDTAPATSPEVSLSKPSSTASSPSSTATPSRRVTLDERYRLSVL